MTLFDPAAFTERLPEGRLSLEPLLAEYGGRVEILASVLGVRRRTVYRWKDTGITYGQADEFAAKVGLHPWTLWPDDWFAGLGDSA